MKKRFLSVIALLCALGLLASCGGTDTDNTSDTTSAGTEADTTAEPEGPIASYLPKTDLDGFTLRISTSENSVDFMYSEESNGDVVNDAVYDAVNLVKDTYNADVSIYCYGESYNDVSSYARNSIQSGDDAFDLINGHDGQMWQMSTEGLFCNLRELKYQDFSQPWWPEYSNSVLEVNQKQYIFSSYMSYQVIGWARAIVMNKSIVEDFGLELPYDSVRDGSWTLDKMISMTKSVYRDLNGNNTQDDKDMYGFIGFYKLYGFQGAFVSCYNEDSDGKITLSYDKERLITVIDKMNSLYNGGEGAYIVGNEPDVTMFLNNQGMFYYDALSIITEKDLRSSDVDYGVLPVPKYDENQDDYKTPSFFSYFAVPVTATETDNISLLIEALSSVGYNNVRPAYFDTALSVKYTRDDDSIEMLNIIGDTLTIDLAYLNTSAGITGLGRALMYCVSNPNAGIASYLESIEPGEQAIIDKLNEFFSAD